MKIRNFEDLLSHLFDSFDPSEKAELEKKREEKEKKSIKNKGFSYRFGRLLIMTAFDVGKSKHVYVTGRCAVKIKINDFILSTEMIMQIFDLIL